MTHKEKVLEMYPGAVCKIDIWGTQWEVPTFVARDVVLNGYVRKIGGQATQILGTSPNSEEEAWEYAWQGVNEIMIKKLEQ